MRRDITCTTLTLLLLLIMGCQDIQKTGYAPSLTEITPIINPEPSPEPLPTIPLTKEEELTNLVLDFKTQYAATFNYLIDFKPQSYMNTGGPGTVIGVCEVYSDGSKQIHINQDWWPTATDVAKKLIVFHELGHCFFNRAHEDRTYSDGRPYSIMRSVIDVLIIYFPQFSSYYIDELKNPMSLTAPSYPIRYQTDVDGTCSED